MDNKHILNIDRIIEHCLITSHFQPLVAVRRGITLGYEALSRGVGPKGITIPPDALFRLAGTRDKRLALDRACREAAFTSFSPIHKMYPDRLLFLNIDASLLKADVIGSGHIEQLAQRSGLEPSSVVLEIIESRVPDVQLLLQFIERHRDLGFMVALDDVGAGHSNLERIAAIKPDILKIDRGLIRNIHRELHRREAVHALTGLARRIGAMIVAEGVEQVEEAVMLLDAGADVLQGYLFAHPVPPGELEDMKTPKGKRTETALKSMMQQTAGAYADFSLARLQERQVRQESIMALAERLRERLALCPLELFTQELATLVSAHKHLECLYVLDTNGLQVTDTVCNPLCTDAHKRFIYHPAEKGTDHSLKEYFLPFAQRLTTGERSNGVITEIVSEPYISLASGNPCLTVALQITAADNNSYILCLDMAQTDALPW